MMKVLLLCGVIHNFGLDAVGSPSILKFSRQPYEAEEMTTLKYFPSLIITDSDHEHIKDVGSVSDPWKVKATLKKGPAGAEALGDLEVSILDGFANFTTLHFSDEGSGYQLEFSVSHPSGSSIPPVDSIEFDVGPRPLGVKFDPVNTLVPNADELKLPFHMWDLGQDIEATSTVLKNQTWDCDLKFSINVPVLLKGTTTTTISEVGTSAGFFLVKFEGSSLNVNLMATCASPETGRSVTGETNTFTIFPGAAIHTGFLHSTTLAMQYTGDVESIETVVNAFQGELGNLECEDCSTKSAPSPRRRRSVSDMLDVKSIQLCSLPIKHRMEKSCLV